MKIKNFLILIIIGIAAVVVYKYSVHPAVLRNLFPDKIWVHRVNSIPKLEETAGIFSGMELDVVWENDNFDVNHPPAESIQLKLEDYLKYLPVSRKGLWIDYKNLKAENAHQSAQHFHNLFDGTNLNKERVYVESPYPKHLGPFYSRGYKVSYYLPSGLSQIKHKDSINKLLDKINLNLKDEAELYISAPFADYTFMREYFPKRKKLLWHLGSLNSPKNKFNIYRALLDKKVEVLLLPYQSEKGNR